WVLSGGPGLPPKHPLWQRPRTRAVVPSNTAAHALALAGIDALELPAAPPAGASVLSRVVSLAETRLPGASISLEVGPRTSGAAYLAEHPLVDELLLTRYRGPTPAAEELAPSPFELATLPAYFGHEAPEERWDEA